MKIDIERINVDEATRIRQDVGDLKSLEESIQQVGLINPVLIDENDNLVAGFRRLRACRNLGWQEIEASVVEFEGDELKILEVEVAENLFRKEFTPDEILAIQKRRDQIAEDRRPKGAFERFWNWMKALFQSDLADEPESPPQPDPVAPPPEPAKDTPEEAAPEASPDSEKPPELELESEPDSANDAFGEAAPEPEPDPEEQSAPETKQEPEPAIETTQTPPSPQPKGAEIIEKDGVRHIKWR